MTRSATPTTTTASSSLRTGVWGDDEHERFREALELFPNGPWKSVAAFVGTRSVRQVQTHAQKYHEKAARRLRDLHKHRARQVAPNVLIDFEMQGICDTLHHNRVALSPRSTETQARSFDAAQSWGSTSQHGASGSALTDVDSWGVPTLDECFEFLLDSLEASSNDSIDGDLLDSSSIGSPSSGSDSDSSYV